MSSPHRSYCHRAELISSTPAISSAPARSFAPARPSERKPTSVLEIPGSDLPDSTRHGSYWPHWPSPGYSRMDGYTSTQEGRYPRIRGGLSLLPRIFRRHQHLPLGCQPRSPECFQLITMRSHQTLPDSVCFPTGLPSDRMDSRTIQLHGRTLHNHNT